MAEVNELLVIDGQNDFCKNAGSLYVQGADEDMMRLSKFVRKNGKMLDDIWGTLDTHHRFDIGHPLFYLDKSGNHPDPHPPIRVTVEDVEQGVMRAFIPKYQSWLEKYTKALRTNGRYDCYIWPEHCLIGSWGHAVHEELFDALYDWQGMPAQVRWVTKGSNFLTEHYSAVMADVIDNDDPDMSIRPNIPWIEHLEKADRIFLAGEALDFCLANTVTDIANLAKVDNFVSKLVLLTDCTSPVFQDGSLAKPFLDSMTARGMKLAKSTDF